MDHASVYVTCPDESSAREIARRLLEARLIACANMIPTKSMFRWHGEIQEAEECVMFLKTTRARVDAVLDAIAAVHPYEVPCAVAFDIDAGLAPYLAWIDEEVE